MDSIDGNCWVRVHEQLVVNSPFHSLKQFCLAGILQALLFKAENPLLAGAAELAIGFVASSKIDFTGQPYAWFHRLDLGDELNRRSVHEHRPELLLSRRFHFL